jgi:hypothetical protein
MSQRLRCALAVLLLLAGCATKPELQRDPYGLSAQPQIYLIHHTARKSFSVERKGEQTGAILFGGGVGVAATTMSQAFRSARLHRPRSADPVLTWKGSLASHCVAVAANKPAISPSMNLPVVSGASGRRKTVRKLLRGMSNSPEVSVTSVAIRSRHIHLNSHRDHHAALGHGGLSDEVLHERQLVDLTRSHVHNFGWVVFVKIEKELPTRGARCVRRPPEYLDCSERPCRRNSPPIMGRC